MRAAAAAPAPPSPLMDDLLSVLLLVFSLGGFCGIFDYKFQRGQPSLVITEKRPKIFGRLSHYWRFFWRLKRDGLEFRMFTLGI